MTDLATMTTPASATDKEAPVEPSQEDSSQEASEETNGGRADRPQPARESNIDAIVAYFESGITQDVSGELGIELEHILVHDDLRPVTYSEPLRRAVGPPPAGSPTSPQATCDPEGDLLGVARPGEAVTLEPAAQLELSAGPFSRLADARGDASTRFERTLERILGPAGRARAHDGLPPHRPGCRAWSSSPSAATSS